MMRGTTWSCSKLLLKRPIRNPNKLKVRHVRTSKNIISNGYWILSSTKKLAVIRMITPTIRDFVALAPTKPTIISKDEIGAASTSYIDPEYFGKNIPNAEFETLWVKRVNIKRPGTINEP